MSEKISFIIPHMGREAMLIETLHSILGLHYPKENIEVIVVSQNDEISETLSSFKDNLDLSVIFNQTNKTISHSRNLGAPQK